MLRSCIQTTDLHACIHTDRKRKDVRTIGRMNELKENIQTDRETISHKNMHTGGRTDGHTDERTHRQTILELVDRQTEIHTTTVDLVISTSVISNNRLSRRENLILVLT